MAGFTVDWFVGLVFAFFLGILASMIGMKVMPRFDAWWLKRREAQREKDEAKKQAFEDEVEKVMRNNHNVIRAYSLLSYYRTMDGLLYVAIGVCLVSAWVTFFAPFLRYEFFRDYMIIFRAVLLLIAGLTSLFFSLYTVYGNFYRHKREVLDEVNHRSNRNDDED